MARITKKKKKEQSGEWRPGPVSGSVRKKLDKASMKKGMYTEEEMREFMKAKKELYAEYTPAEVGDIKELNRFRREVMDKVAEDVSGKVEGSAELEQKVKEEAGRAFKKYVDIEISKGRKVEDILKDKNKLRKYVRYSIGIN